MRNKFRGLYNEENDIKREYGRNKYRNRSEEDKGKLREYQISKKLLQNKRKIIFFSIWVNVKDE